MSSTGRGKPRSPRDFYVTPEACIMPLVEELRPYYQYGSPYRLLDPGAGDGRIGRMLAEGLGQPPIELTAVECDHELVGGLLENRPPCEVHHVVTEDYLQWCAEHTGYSLIVSNPPFSLAREFVEHSLSMLSEDGLAVFLVNMNFLGSRKRLDLFREHPPSFMRVLTPRPSFTGGGNDSVDCIWIGWRGPAGPKLDPFGWYDCARSGRPA